MKKGFLFLIVFLFSLPGCWGRCKKSPKQNTKKMAQRPDVFSRVNIPLADDTVLGADDDTVRSFYDDDMQDFMTFAHEADDFELEQAAGPRSDTDKYTWLNDRETPENQKELETVYFDFDRYGVRQNERAKAKRNATKLKEHVKNDPGLTVVVEGHACASAGSAAYNLALSEKRAKSKADFLKASGVPADRIKTVGRGKEMLVVKEGGREEQWVNRRVELHEVYDNIVAPAA